jgi:hypothetical protein
LSRNQTHRCQEIGRGGGGGGQWLRQAAIYRGRWQRLHSVELGLGFVGAAMRSSNIISNHRSASGWGLGGGGLSGGVVSSELWVGLEGRSYRRAAEKRKRKWLEEEVAGPPVRG